MTLENIEHRIQLHSLPQMLSYENGKADYRKMSDIDLCHIVDYEILPELGKRSVYQLTLNEKRRIAEILYRRFRAGESQIKRCMAMVY